MLAYENYYGLKKESIKYFALLHKNFILESIAMTLKEWLTYNMMQHKGISSLKANVIQAPYKILILGSGGLSIGQAGEFDYSGSQVISFREFL